MQQIVNHGAGTQRAFRPADPGAPAPARGCRSASARAVRSAPSTAAVIPGAGAYERRRFETFFFDSHLSIDEAEVIAGALACRTATASAIWQADEVAAALQDKSIKFSQQFYSGLRRQPRQVSRA